MIARAAAAMLVGLLVSLGAGAVGATPAAAHASEVGSSPEAGATLDAPPRTVAVEFDSAILDVGAAIVVRAADGSSVMLGAPRIERQQISVDVDPAAAPGKYTVAYRVVAEDGHTIESTFDFTVAGTALPAEASERAAATPAAPSAAPSAAPTAAPAEDGSSPPYLLLGAGALVVVLAVAGALALRR